MSVISENDLKNYEEYTNFTKYENEKAKFNTKIASDMKHNDEIVDILGFLKGKDIYNDRYIVRFNDDTIDDNIMRVELEFDYVKNPVQEDIRRTLSKIIKSYDLNDKEIEELKTATINYDYEANDGTVFTRVESVEKLFTEDDNETRINPTVKQLKAMAEFIKETRKYYLLYGYEKYTEKVIDLILSKDENDITRLEFLNEIKDMINHNIMCYSNNYSLGEAKAGYENEFKKENKKLILIEELIREEKQKDEERNIPIDFINDKEKMRDFYKLSKREFLESYSYLTEEEYDSTKAKVEEKQKVRENKAKER